MNNRLEHDKFVKPGSIKIIFKLKKEENNEKKIRKSTKHKNEKTLDQADEFQTRHQEKSYEIVNKRCVTQKPCCLCERKGYDKERVFSKEKIEERKRKRKYRRRLEKLSRELRKQAEEYRTEKTSSAEIRNNIEKCENDDLLEALIENTGVPVKECSGSTEMELINSFNESVLLLELGGRVLKNAINRESNERHKEEKNKKIFEHYVLLEALIENTGVPVKECSGSTDTEVINSFNESVHLLELGGRVLKSTINTESNERHKEEKNKKIFEHYVEIIEVPVVRMKDSTKPKDKESNKLLKLEEKILKTNGERKYNTFEFDDLLETLAECTGVPVIKPTDLSEAKVIGSINEAVQLLKLRNILSF